jgi:curved DNA-binding protein CbpA
MDLYSILNVRPEASQEDIRSAYREIARRFHPDRDPSPEAAQVFKAANDAYMVLSDSERRAAYDRARGSAAAPERGMIPAGPGGMFAPSRAPERPGRRPEAPPPPRRELTLWEKMMSPGAEPEVPGEMYSAFAPAAAPARRPPPEAYEPQASFQPQAPAIVLPSLDDLADHIVAIWPLEGIWDFIRQVREDPGFRRTGLVDVNTVAGAAYGASVEYELAEFLGIPEETVREYDRRGLLTSAFWNDIVSPMLEAFPRVMDALKPRDLPGVFFLNYGADGIRIDLYYSEA